MNRADVRIKYTNYKGETSWRVISPVGIRFGPTVWHQEPQWLLSAMDLDKNEYREFAVKDIVVWLPINKDLNDKDKIILALELEVEELKKKADAFDRMKESL